MVVVWWNAVYQKAVFLREEHRQVRTYELSDQLSPSSMTAISPRVAFQSTGELLSCDFFYIFVGILKIIVIPRLEGFQACRSQVIQY